MAGGHLQKTPGQQEKYEHGHRVVIDLAITTPGMPDTGGKRGQYRQRHRHIHAQLVAAQIARGGGEKRLRRIGHHRRGQHQTDPAQKLADPFLHALCLADIQADRQHHHLHRAQSGHRQPAQRHCALALLQGFLTTRIKGMGDIADGSDGGQDGAEPGLALVPAHPCAMRGVVDAEFQHPGQRVDMVLVEPDAGGTDDPFQDQRRFAYMFVLLADKALLQIAAIVQFQTAQLFRNQVLGAARGRGAMLVKIAQASRHNRFRDRRTAVTAHRLTLAIDHGGIGGAGHDRQATVKATDVDTGGVGRPGFSGHGHGR